MSTSGRSFPFSASFGTSNSYSEQECTLHPGKPITMVCVTCQDELVCPTCIKCDHKKHEFLELDDVVQDRQNLIFQHLDVSENSLLKLTDNVTQVNKRLRDYNEQVDNIVRQIRSRGEVIKNNVDRVTEDHIREVERIRRKNVEKLAKVVDQLKRLETEILKYSKSGKSLPLSMIDTSPIRQALGKNGNRPLANASILEVPKFVPGDFNLLEVRNLFGELRREAKSVMVVTNNQMEQAYSFLSSKDLGYPNPGAALENPVRVSEHETEVTNICPINNTEAWVVLCDTDEVNLMSTISKKPIQVVTTSGVEVIDVTTSPDRRRTLICCADRSIREIKGIYGRTKVIFYTEAVPSSLVVTRENFIIVAFKTGGLIIKFDSRGNVLHKVRGSLVGRIDFDNTPKPMRLRQNPRNGDLVLFNRGSGYVTVMDSDMRIRFHSACGKSQVTGQFVKKGGISHFMVVDACFDSLGNIYVVDTLRCAILVLDKRGSILRTVMNRQEYVPRPTAIGVQPDDRVWLGYEDGTVQTRETTTL
ncbi:uncharacterized protein LOC117342702 [Pecten maximus]|uniref:uncharacterized protein LOC117342702 n=1 Tax=Pecten maximus TaxID=6579 RepID=UPI001458110A|nr:uncharacterized protein LOC117342702 [Pecten maximus]